MLITHDPMEACRLSHRLLVLPAPGGIDDGHHSPACRRAPDDPRCWPASGAAATAHKG
ncbi:MAG: hypothetical protein ACLR17_06450 [Enterobacteriaceae bacterium]